MKRLFIISFLSFLALAGCKDAAYREADKLTYEAVAPEYRNYVERDAGLDAKQKARRLNTLDTWGMRCGAVAAVQS